MRRRASAILASAALLLGGLAAAPTAGAAAGGPASATADNTADDVKVFTADVTRAQVIVNIATTSGGYRAAGRQLNRYRNRQLALRAKLQHKRTKSARRRLKQRSRRERRHVRNTNHVIAKTIVTEAERTGRGLSLEDLKGIRTRVRLRKPWGHRPAEGWGRVALHSWAFAQLAHFIVYKARRAGVPLAFVDPAHSSSECAQYGHADRRNRTSQARFICRSCGVVAHADRNASHVLARRGESVWTAGRESRVPAVRPTG